MSSTTQASTPISGITRSAQALTSSSGCHGESAIPTWHEGDTFLAGSDLRKFRILDVNTDEVPDGAHGVFTVEKVEGPKAN